MKFPFYILSLLLLPAGCASQGQQWKALIDARSHKMEVETIRGLERSIPDALLPEGEWDKRILQNQLNDMRDRITAELRRCERFGLYTIVDSVEQASIVLTTTLEKVSISGDTVRFPFILTITNKPNGTSRSEKFEGMGIMQSAPKGADSTRIQIIRMGTALMENNRTFPYSAIAELFYKPVK